MGNCYETGTTAQQKDTSSHDNDDEKKHELIQKQLKSEKKEEKVEEKDVMENTIWKTTISDTNVASLSYTISKSSKSTPFIIKGVCYSPCPIGESNKNAPNIGDWFWDSYQTSNGTQIGNWSHYWDTNKNDNNYRHDLDNIRDLGANTIRIYCALPYQLNQSGNQFVTDHEYKHTQFLDACYQRNLFVLVGYPMPVNIFEEGSTSIPSQKEWKSNFTELVKATGQHPAVIGYIFMNEKDGQKMSFSKSKAIPQKVKEQLTYYWSQCESIAKISKQYAPNKLCGQAFHDMTEQWTLTNAPYLNKMEHVDFWGVNTYQTVSLDPVFNKGQPSGQGAVEPLGFNNLKIKGYPNTYKPVILTEIGWPATGHKDATDPKSIYYDKETGTNTENVIHSVLPQAYKKYPLCLGACYFEYCDEWWNQAPNPIYKWYGGPSAPGFPNGYWDNEGFGLYQTEKNPKIPNKKDITDWPINWNQDGNAPYPYADKISARKPTLTAITEIFTAQ